MPETTPSPHPVGCGCRWVLVGRPASPDSGQFVGNELKLGARGDSYYEYLLKQFIQSGGTDTRARRMYDEAVSGIHAQVRGGQRAGARHCGPRQRAHVGALVSSLADEGGTQLVHRSQPNDFTYIAEKMAGSSGINPKMDHLVCFLPGTLALGVTQGQRIDQVRDELDAATLAHWELAEELMATCYEMYRSTATGLAPEIVYFNTQGSGGSDLIIKPADRHNLLRPETVERHVAALGRRGAAHAPSLEGSRCAGIPVGGRRGAAPASLCCTGCRATSSTANGAGKSLRPLSGTRASRTAGTPAWTT